MSTKKVMYNGQEVEAENCPPTWEAIMPMLLQVHTTLQSKVYDGTITDNELNQLENLRTEFLRMAKCADSFNEIMKEGRDENNIV